MLVISELVALSETLDEGSSSPLARSLALAWGCESARFVRSSANHVFDCGPLFLRFRPHDLRWPDAVPEAALSLAAAGAPLAPAVRALDGRLTVIDGPYAATAIAAVRGRQLESGSLSRADARSWGRALAHLHEVGSRAPRCEGLPEWPELVRAANAECAAELATLPREQSGYDVVHGDPELDNVVWGEDGPVFVDLDDLAYSWLAADVSFALRDFAEPAQAPDPESEPVASFLAGYAEVRPLAAWEIEAMPVFARAHAAVTLHRLRPVLAEQSQPGWPEWANALRARVAGVAAVLEEAIAANGDTR